MHRALLPLGLTAALAAGLFFHTSAKVRAADPARTAHDGVENDVPELSLLEAVKKGVVSVNAEGLGDGRMDLTVTNRTKRPLRVVLPPGLIASGAAGQFGGIGGIGGLGGIGGQGLGGLGLGGLGAGGLGWGGLGSGTLGGLGGIGGVGTGASGVGGLSTGGGMGMGSGTMPASMGMMMLSQLIMSLIGSRDSWDQRSVMIGMGGMGGGLGMGGLGLGGLGGGFRSVPPTDLPFANLKPSQTRHLPTRLVALSSPSLDHPVERPEKGEKLQIGDISQVSDNPIIQKALKRLAADKAPITIAQLVMWRLASGLDWDTIARLSEGWANAHELTLARQFVEKLGALPEGESGTLLYQVTASDKETAKLADALNDLLKEKTVLGLKAESGIPARPEGPAIACRVQITGTAEKPEAQVQVATTDGGAESWAAAGQFTLPIAREAGKVTMVEFADALAEGVLSRLVRAQLSKGPVVKGKPTYKIRIDNASPLVLNGLAVLGEGSKAHDTPKVLTGICVSPRKSMTVPATAVMVEQLGLKKGVRVIAVDLSGL